MAYLDELLLLIYRISNAIKYCNHYIVNIFIQLRWINVSLIRILRVTRVANRFIELITTFQIEKKVNKIKSGQVGWDGMVSMLFGSWGNDLCDG